MEEKLRFNNMKIKIKVHAGSSQEKIKKINNFDYEVWLKTKAIENKANLDLIKILKKYFKKNIKIIKGLKSKFKIIEVY